MRYFIIFALLCFITACWNDGPSDSRYFSPLWMKNIDVKLSNEAYYIGNNDWIKEDIMSPWRLVNYNDQMMDLSYALIKSSSRSSVYKVIHVTSQSTRELTVEMPTSERLNALCYRQAFPVGEQNSKQNLNHPAKFGGSFI